MMDFRLPELGEGIHEAELVEWLVQPGDVIKRGQGIAEVMTDKATMELPSPFDGRITELHAEAGGEIKVGVVILAYESDTAEKKTSKGKSKEKQKTKRSDNESNGKKAQKQDAEATSTATKVRAAPSVRRMARQLGVDLAGVQGSGPGGRILIDDVYSSLVQRDDATGSVRPTRKVAAVKPEFVPGTRVKMHGIRRKIAEHMVRSKQTIPHYSYMDQCNATELVRLRDSLKPKCEESGFKLTYLAFIVKAVVAALKEVPLVNSTLDEQSDEIVLHGHYNIGIATSAPGGLIVPVIKDADKKTVIQLAREIQRLSTDARQGRSSIADLRDGTFTITSIGNIGGLISTPIINHPEVGIIGIGKIVRQPVYDHSGMLVPADMVYLSFSFDHRVVDGAIGAEFGTQVICRLENPTPLLVDFDE